MSVERPLVVKQMDGLEVRVRTVSGNPLIHDYLCASPALARFYPGHPDDPHAFRRHAVETAAYDRPHLAGLADAIRPTTTRAAEKWQRVVRGEGFVVTTGQQAGLFGGPAYTFLKILSAVRLAETLEALLDRPVVALFWVPGDDHDFAEVGRVSVLDRMNELRRIELEPPAVEPRSMARLALGESITAAVEAFSNVLPDTDSAVRIRDVLSRTYRPGVAMADAYIAMLRELLDGFDVLITASSDSAIKQASAPVLEREIREAARHEKAVAMQTARLEEAGYYPQVAVAPGAANVMFEDESGRERLMRSDSEWQLRRTRRSFSDAQLLDRLAREPMAFSANVLLRPVVESHLFPTLAYVGGPSEVAYFAQIGCLFREHGVPMPLVIPRYSTQLVEAKVRKVLSKFQLEPNDLGQPFHELAAQVTREELPAGVSDALAAAKRHLTEDYGALLSASSGIDPTLRGPLESARNASFKHVDDSERKILTHLKKQNEVHLMQLRKAASNLYPDGAPQERVLSLLPYVARYGEGLLREILDAMTPSPPSTVPAWSGIVCD